MSIVGAVGVLAFVAPIGGGVVDTEDVAVVGIVDNEGGGTCTGSLIAANVVLTAQHCVAQVIDVDCAGGSFGPPRAPGGFFVTTLDTFSFDPDDYHAVASIVIPPGIGFCGRDLALLVLTAPIDATEAAPIDPRVDTAAAAGETYSAIGFGATDDNGTDSGQRRRRDDLTIACAGTGCEATHIGATEWRGEAGICLGDSGGPAVDTSGLVIGVVSRGSFGCIDPIYADVAANRDWLIAETQAAADGAGIEPPPWAMGGGPGTPDAGASEPDGGAPDPDPDAGGDPETSSGCACTVGPNPARRGWLGGGVVSLWLLAVAWRLLRRT